MAVDMIARMMAMGNGGGTVDAYTKDETDALLDSKADESYVDGIADMIIDKMQLWADYIADYDTAMLAKQATLDMSDSEKKQQFVMQKVHLQKLKSKYAYLQAYYEQHGELPETVTFDSITNAGGCMYRTESDGEVKVAVLKGSANGMIVDSPDFTATASTSDASRTTAHQISNQFGIEISGWGWISVSIETTGTLFSSFNWSGYPSASPAWWGVQMSGNTYIPVITGTRNINAYTFDNGILFSLPENTVDAETPWDYYNNYVLPDLAAGNAAFPTGYTPTPKAKFYTKDETDELNSGKVDKNGTDSLMTAAEHTKLSGIESGAEVNVQSDWSQSDSSADDYIKNKPTIPEAQVNADWNAVSGVEQILNKPTIPTVDQTYSASSTNAQSGVAVASAISGKISATDYATQTTGGTVKAWTTTDGSDTILHLATQ